MQTLEILDQIQSSALRHATEQRVMPDSAPIGSGAHQGDVYLWRLAALPADVTKKTKVRQLAPGETQGSRHTVGDHVTVLNRTDEGKVIERTPGQFEAKGPILECDERFRLMHPEHADHSLPAGIYEVTYQVDTRSMQRVKD